MDASKIHLVETPLNKTDDDEQQFVDRDRFENGFHSILFFLVPVVRCLNLIIKEITILHFNNKPTGFFKA